MGLFRTSNALFHVNNARLLTEIPFWCVTFEISNWNFRVNNCCDDVVGHRIANFYLSIQFSFNCLQLKLRMLHERVANLLIRFMLTVKIFSWLNFLPSCLNSSLSLLFKFWTCFFVKLDCSYLFWKICLSQSIQTCYILLLFTRNTINSLTCCVSLLGLQSSSQLFEKWS